MKLREWLRELAHDPLCTRRCQGCGWHLCDGIHDSECPTLTPVGGKQEAPEVKHLAPMLGGGPLRCCGRSIYDVPAGSVTIIPGEVTCRDTPVGGEEDSNEEKP